QKWESGRSCPSGDNLIRICESFNISIDEFLGSRNDFRLKLNLKSALHILMIYAVIYIILRLLFSDFKETNLTGVLFTEHLNSYLPDWILSSGIYYIFAFISAMLALLGNTKASLFSIAGVIIGLVAGMIFGPNPEGAYSGNSHYGWLIFIICYLISALTGLLISKNSIPSKSRDV
ncbi:MAG: helix-turn-helix domain-containing protein, partial [Erysipelotrichaceae bacterium]